MADLSRPGVMAGLKTEIDFGIERMMDGGDDDQGG
jgi:hypothetical protein